jgi:hypothetical protein
LAFSEVATVAVWRQYIFTIPLGRAAGAGVAGQAADLQVGRVVVARVAVDVVRLECRPPVGPAPQRPAARLALSAGPFEGGAAGA